MGSEQQELKIRFNVRGSLITTLGSKFSKFPNTKLGKLTKDAPEYNEQLDEYFIDRNPMVFHFILDFYDKGELHLPKTLCAGSIKNELEFWEIQENVLRSCCWKTRYNDEDDSEAYAMINDLDFKVKPERIINNEGMGILKHERKLRYNIWRILQKPASSILGKAWFTLVFFSVTVSILVFGLSTTNIYSLQDSTKHNASEAEKEDHLANTTLFRHCVLWTDFASNLILFIDFLLQLYSCPNKKEFAFNLLNYIDLLVSALIFHIVYSDLSRVNGHEDIMGPSIFKYVYALRALRLFRLLMHTRGMKIIKLCIKVNFIEFLFFAALFLTCACIFAAVIYFAEQGKNSEFTDFFESIWWALITLTTVGYGDKVPESVFGHVIGTMAAFSGILIATIPIVVISSNYGNFYSCYKVRDKHKKSSLPVKNFEEGKASQKKKQKCNNSGGIGCSKF
ncbi:potassium voltage-gated channel protein Shaw-like [Crassostrea angulata]|uniref:potassium voltage-gated channel protein Shaw-like n=1 Tax=Magallana angulata TaxID=2784310 RepID=UPI0022B1B34B|nr:potassium voltage-gated channel protein Shaw-like [Crassostrea angulata]